MARHAVRLLTDSQGFGPYCDEVLVIMRPVNYQGLSCERGIRACHITIYDEKTLHMPRSDEAPGLFTGSVGAKTLRTRMSCGSARSLDILNLYGCRIACG